jgi:hypothetical protein
MPRIHVTLQSRLEFKALQRPCLDNFHPRIGIPFAETRRPVISAEETLDRKPSFVCSLFENSRTPSDKGDITPITDVRTDISSIKYDI